MPNIRSQVSSDFVEKIVQVNRVSKKTKGGNQIGFSILVVVGDKKGQVGISFGKGPDVLSSIRKGVRRARKHLIKVPMKGTTIPFQVTQKHGAAKVLLKPAPKGSGIIAGGAVRAVVEAAGIHDIVGKSLGSNNQANTVYATYKGLQEIRRLVNLKDIKLKPSPLSSATLTPPAASATFIKTASKPVVKKTAPSASAKKPAPTKNKPTSAKKGK